MDNIIRLDTVDDYNKLFGLETLHPLVAVVDLDDATKFPAHFTVNYGDIIKGTSLGQEIKSYSFFSYSSSEALHLSEDERSIILDCLRNIKTELVHPVDKLSKRLIARNIQLLLDYCMRFYERQFITRAVANKGILSRFETLLDEYFGNIQQDKGLPTVRYFADKVCLSSNYFGDLIKKETGKTAQEYIQNKIVDLAKEKILGTGKNVSQIAYELGFQYPQHFNRLFKKSVGCTPNEYRKFGA